MSERHIARYSLFVETELKTPAASVVTDEQHSQAEADPAASFDWLIHARTYFPSSFAGASE
jgi:hypothetical protein